MPVILEAEKMVFNHLSVEDGLTNNFVKTIFKDKYGYIWFGTLEGINRYDGVEVRSFNKYFPNNTNSVTSIFEDKDHRLWIGTESGLYFWNRIANVFTEFSSELFLNARINKLVGNGENQILCSTEKGFFIIDVKTLKVDQILFHRDINALLNQVNDFIIENEQLYLATKGGLIQYDLNIRCSVIYNVSRINGEDVSNFSCLTKVNDTVYLGTQTHGIIGFSLKSKKYFEYGNFQDKIVLSLSNDSTKLFIGTDSDGLIICDFVSNDFQSVEHIDNDATSLSSDAIYSILVDNTSTLWVGTYAGGVNYASLVDKTFKTYGIDDNKYNPSTSVRSLLFKGNNKYIGTRDGLYIINNDQRVQYFSNENSILRSKIVLSFNREGDDVILGTYNGGVYKIVGNSKIIDWHKDLFSNESVYDFERDKNGNLWIATLSGLYKQEEGIINSIKEVHGSDSENWIYCIKIDSLNRIWVGSMLGARVFQINKNNSLEFLADLPKIKGYKVTDFYIDKTNAMWISTEKQGIFQVDMDFNIINHLSEDSGLSNNSVCSIIQTTDEEFWIGTLKGLTRYNTDDNSITNYYKSNGLPGLVFNPNAIVNDKNGQVWMGNEKGLVYFNPKSVVNGSGRSNIVITDVYIGGKALAEQVDNFNNHIEGLTSIELRGKDNNLGFRFVNLSIPNINANKYSVRIRKQNSIDEEWMALNNQNRIYFNSIKPGNYQFEIALVDGSGLVIKDSIKTLSVRITSEWYQSIFVLVGIIVFIVFLIAVFVFSIKSVRKKLKEAKSQISDDDKERYESSRLDIEKSKALLSEIQDFVVKSEVYLNSDLKIGELAEQMNYSIHDISQAVNQNLNQGFTDFINYYRVEKVKNRLQDPKYSKFTLLAVAEKCGFNSKSSFYRAFKKVTGKTPSEYWNEIQK
ncbi:ligand-binding sensor domain-containing protein [Plebeiibacterium sediminum]|uniref:Helix-turn-helix domain-containing protein n=1 Tax=Plebeiibacterium sediminum TaxID=2992112 RepID=A0AAE3M5W2_9BACT|nr:AraC family transcriptional regulator [Plebeiobacterium sediminum]MCW3787658.1 helix-turn-helix domain-containing protein [Plebeiobacterium sediminum]